MLIGRSAGEFRAGVQLACDVDGDRQLLVGKYLEQAVSRPFDSARSLPEQVHKEGRVEMGHSSVARAGE